MYVAIDCRTVTVNKNAVYHHIDIIYEPHTKLLGFAWNDGDDKCYYKFLVRPFALSTATFVFIKVTRQLLKK